jgi:hypothetical protein
MMSILRKKYAGQRLKMPLKCLLNNPRPEPK